MPPKRAKKRMLAKLNNNARLSNEVEEGMESQQAGTSSPPPKKREKRDQRKTPPKKKEKRDQRKTPPKKKEKARKKMAEEEPLEEGEQDMDVQQRRVRKAKRRYPSFVNDYYGFVEPGGFSALDHHHKKTIYGCSFFACQASYPNSYMAARHISVCNKPKKRAPDGQKQPRTRMEPFDDQEKELDRCIRAEPAKVFRTKAFHLIILLGVHPSTNIDMYSDVLDDAMMDYMEKSLDQAPKEDQDRLRKFMQRRLENHYLGPKMWRMGGRAAGFRFGFCYEFIGVQYRKAFEETLVECWSGMSEEEKEEARRLFGRVNLRSWGTDPLAPVEDVLQYNVITTVEEYDKASEQERLRNLKVDDKANWEKNRQNVKKGQSLPDTCSGIVHYEELVEHRGEDEDLLLEYEDEAEEPVEPEEEEEQEEDEAEEAC